jgi:hypothetical protein
MLKRTRRDTQHTTGGQQNENVARRAGAKGARIRDLRSESSRNQVSVLILVHKTAISRAGVGDTSGVLPVPSGIRASGVRGHHDGGTNVHPGLAKPDSVYYRSIIENPLSLALLGKNMGPRLETVRLACR